MHSLKQQPASAPVPRHAGYVHWADGPALGYAVLRLWMGVTFTVYGINKLKNLNGFADAIVGQFEKTVLPAWSVRPYALALPFVELLIGVLLVLGLATRFALVLGGLTIVSLTFGTALRGETQLVGAQLLYAIAFALLLAGLGWNALALDRKFKPGDGFIEGFEIAR